MKFRSRNEGSIHSPVCHLPVVDGIIARALLLKTVLTVRGGSTSVMICNFVRLKSEVIFSPKGHACVESLCSAY